MSLPRVLFVCVQNAGRSQLAQALYERRGGEARSAGSKPAEHVHPEVVEALREVGIDIEGREPRGISRDDVEWTDLVVTMGCGDASRCYRGSATWTGSCPIPRRCRSTRCGSCATRSSSASVDWARSRGRVELVRVVEDRRLGRARGPRVVVGGDRVQQLGPRVRRRAPSARSSIRRSPRWTWPSSRPSSVCAEGRPALELARAADVVEQRGRQQQIGPQPRVQLRRLAAERRDADRVLEQPARVGVVAVSAAGSARSAARSASSARKRADRLRGARRARSRRRGTRGSRRARRRRAASRARTRPGRPPAASSERTSSCSRSRKRSTRPEHAHGVALAEAAVEQLDVASRRAPRSGRSGRRARARGTARPPFVRRRSLRATA